MPLPSGPARRIISRLFVGGDTVFRITVAVAGLLELFVAVLLATVQSTHSWLAHERYSPFHDAILPRLVDNGFWGLAAILIAWASQKLRPRQMRWTGWLQLYLPLSVGLSLIHDAISLATRTLAATDQTAFTFRALHQVFWRECYSNQWMFWTTVVIYWAISYYHDLRRSHVRAAELQTHLALAELENLRVQLQPHFLFNTLNTIASFVRERPAEAEDLIFDLCELLREALETRSAQLVPLSQELATLERYLNIQKARFTDRLLVEQSIAPETLSAAVPHLLLQPIVENAIRHGIAHRSDGGRISIAASRENKHVCLRVWDNGPGSRLPVREGVGLSNTRNRLKQLYGPECNLNIETGESGFSVSLRIPFESSRVRTRQAVAAV